MTQLHHPGLTPAPDGPNVDAAILRDDTQGGVFQNRHHRDSLVIVQAGHRFGEVKLIMLVRPVCARAKRRHPKSGRRTSDRQADPLATEIPKGDPLRVPDAPRLERGDQGVLQRILSSRRKGDHAAHDRGQIRLDRPKQTRLSFRLEIASPAKIGGVAIEFDSSGDS